MNFNRFRNVVSLLAFALCFFPFLADAFTMTPMVSSLNPKGRGRSTTFDLVNQTKSRKAIKMGVYKRVHDIDGNETHEAVDKKLFNVYPPRAILEAGKKRKVRVTWRGPMPDKELAFRFIAEEESVKGLKKIDKSKTKAHINVLIRYSAGLYVRPENVKPSLAVEDIAYKAKGEIGIKDRGVRKDDKGKKSYQGPVVEVLLKNDGTKHQILLDSELTLKYKNAAGKDVMVKYDSGEYEHLGYNNLLPGDKRLVKLPWIGEKIAKPATFSATGELKIKKLKK